MKTVPTLCATGCSLGLAAVGCTVAIECSETSQRTTPSNHTHPRPYQHTRDQTPPRVISPSERPNSLPFSTSPDALHLPQKARTEHTHTTSGSEPVYVETTISGDVSPEAQSSIRRRISRLRRLSSLTLSGSPSSHGPASRTLTQSSDSTAPLFKTEPTSTPLPPNKLVKRSLSQHMSHNPFPPNLPNKKQTFRRPATSHQRSAALPFGTEDTHTPSPVKPAHTHISTDFDSRTYKNYFTVRVSGQHAETPSNENTLDDNKYRIRRLNVKSGSTPHLVAARLIQTPIDIEPDESVESQDSANRSLSYRPRTAHGFPGFTSSPPSVFVGTVGSESGNNSYRSLSFGNILSRESSPSWKKSGKGNALGRRLTLRSNRRAVSAPLVSMDEGMKNSAEDGSKLTKRRNTRISSSETKERRLGIKVPSEIPYQYEATAKSGHQPQATAEQVNHATMSPTIRPASQGSPSLSYSASSVGLTQSGSRPSRLSETPSDVNSSQLGSDHDVRVFSSGDDDDGDNRSDTVYDSLRTGATRSSSGRYATKLESLFDKFPAADQSDTGVTHDNVPQHLTPNESELHIHSSVAEEEESLSTPVRTVTGEERNNSQGHGLNRTPKARFSVSPHLAFHQLKLGELEWDGLDDEREWSEDEDDGWTGTFDGTDHAQESPLSQRSRKDTPHAINNSQNQGNPNLNPPDLDVKNSLFDWSEQPVLERNSSNTHLPRPKTVHGKKGSDSRGNRALGVRGAGRAPSGLHARSHSVPITPDAEGRRAQIKNKFGTWGIASKGVPEDWNDDFDFDDEANDSSSNSNQPSKGEELDIRAVVVPNSIREQQTNVIANIGLLREWGLHIEELKELRMRAASLEMLQGDHAPLFDEVDAMIDLADQEVEDANPLSVETTPDFKVGRRDSPGTEQTDKEQIARGTLHESPAVQSSPSNITWTPPAPTSRPRKDSEAIAQSVIEALQQRRTLSEEVLHEQQRSRKKKVPFDTATLKHIVPYVNGLMRKVKQAIRETEGLQESPKMRSSTPDPPLRQAFMNHGHG